MSDRVLHFFSAESPLRASIPGFHPREQQREMALKVDEAIRQNQILVTEAGTGTGKTYAYLIPALLSGGKVVISTGTKTLQDQLFTRDLPTVRAALKVPVTVAVLKGRANYVCHYHLERNGREGRFLTPQEAMDLRQIASFARMTATGDRSQCNEVGESSPAWLAAVSSRENCLGQDCPYLKECFVMAARRAAMDADVVVVNHHLFFADLMLREEGVGELLPACNTVIFDEAHQLPDTASVFFGDKVGTAQFLELARDTRSETLAGAPDCRTLIDETRHLEKSVRDFRLVFDQGSSRFSVAQALSRKGFCDALAHLEEKLKKFEQVLQTQAARSEGLENCLHRTEALREKLSRWQSPDESGLIRWVEVLNQSVSLHSTPLNIADIFSGQLQAQLKAWIFTSATLAIGQSFAHYCREMGLDRMDPYPQTAVWGSPFNYAEQALLYSPQAMPDPNSPDYFDTMVDRILPLIIASHGRAFVLCTSLRAMRIVHEGIARGLEKAGLHLPLLLQGEGSRSQLLERFRLLGNVVLVASHSFWEGVDVPGDALSLVVIDKLPFAPPDDPVLTARIEHIQRQGLNPFMHYQLPRTVIDMKQGAGRLIRNENDRGLLCICDPRMLSRSYGKVIWRSLPPMKRTREEAEAIAFLEKLPPPKSPGGQG